MILYIIIDKNRTSLKIMHMYSVIILLYLVFFANIAIRRHEAHDAVVSIDQNSTKLTVKPS